MTHNTKCVEPGSGSASARIRRTHLRGLLAARIRHIWRAYWEWCARRAVALLLQSLDDRTLKDLGISPDDIACAPTEFGSAARHLSRLPEADLRIGLLGRNEAASRRQRARVCFLGWALLVLVGFGPRPLLAQAAPPEEQIVQARSAEFHARIRELAGKLADAPLLRGLSAQEREKRVEFVGANMIFVLTHELGHAVISEMDLPVLGQEEDAADAFAILTALDVVATEFSLRVLVNASKGWFLSARRDKKDGETPDYYGRHGLK
jgi:uncharacterized protein YjiS (DUF1127 family)